MNIIKDGKLKRTRYLLLDRPELGGFYTVVKYSINGRVYHLFRTKNLVEASKFFDKLFKK